jgi:antitoxin component of MazEF toxin-antitoxin module
MRVIKVEDGLAVKLPEHVVKVLDLKEGDEVDLDVSRPHLTALGYPKLSREDAVKRLLQTRIPVPPGFNFSRDEANER